MAEEPSTSKANQVLLQGRFSLLRRQPWLVFVLPFAIFMLATSLEPTPDRAGGADLGFHISYCAYPWVYTVKIALTAMAMAFVLRGYGQFPLRVQPLALAVGVFGAFVWVALSKLGWEQYAWAVLGWEGVGARSEFDPFVQFSENGVAAWGFLTVRFLGLIVVVPIVEEFFLRGFVMRFLVDAKWWDVPFGTVNVAAVVVGTLVPMLSHPGELLAAAVWFSMITWLMIRTRNLWDCVAAHAVTNLLLGLYAVLADDWTML